MAIPRVELLVRRRIVKAFIDVDFADIELRRIYWAKNERGARVKSDPTLLGPQRVRLIVSKRRYNTSLVNSEAGEIEKYPYNLIGAYNMDIEEDDTFTHLGNEYKVISIEPDREERTLVALEYFGQHHPFDTVS